MKDLKNKNIYNGNEMIESLKKQNLYILDI